MKQIMYRSYVEYISWGDSHEETKGNNIHFTFFAPSCSDFDCILVEIPDNMAVIPTWNQERKIRFWERKMSDILVDGERRRLNVNIGRRDKYYYGDIEDVNDIPEESYLPKINTYNNVELKIIDVQYTTVKENAEKFGCEYIENGKKLIRDLLKKVSREIEIHDEIKMLEKDRALRNVTTIEELKEEITIESNNYFALIAAGEVLKTVKISDVVKAAGIKGMKTNEIIIAAKNAKKELPDYRLVIMREDPIENYSLLQNGVFTCCEFDNQ